MLSVSKYKILPFNSLFHLMLHTYNINTNILLSLSLIYKLNNFFLLICAPPHSFTFNQG